MTAPARTLDGSLVNLHEWQRERSGPYSPGQFRHRPPPLELVEKSNSSPKLNIIMPDSRGDGVRWERATVEGPSSCAQWSWTAAGDAIHSLLLAIFRTTSFLFVLWIAVCAYVHSD